MVPRKLDLRLAGAVEARNNKVLILIVEIEPFSATLAQNGLAEYDQSGKNPLKYSAMAGN